jgi:hypothetical protein
LDFLLHCLTSKINHINTENTENTEYSMTRDTRQINFGSFFPKSVTNLTLHASLFFHKFFFEHIPKGIIAPPDKLFMPFSLLAPKRELFIRRRRRVYDKEHYRQEANMPKDYHSFSL